MVYIFVKMLYCHCFLQLHEMEKYQLKGAVHVKHGEAKPESEVAAHLSRQLEDVHAEVNNHHSGLFDHNQFDHAAVHLRGLSSQRVLM